MPLPFELDLDALDALPVAERNEVRAQLQRLDAGAQANPLWSYWPHVKQRGYHSITAPLGAFVGGNRSGKSYGGTADDILQLVDVESLPPWLVPYKRWHGECHWRVVTPNLKTTLLQVVLPLFRRLVPKDQLYKGSWDRAYNGDNRILTFANGNTVDFLTHDMDLDAFSGAEKHGIRLDEEPKGYKGRQIYEESMMRLLSTGGEFRMTFTPLFGLSWSYYELTSKEQGSNRRRPRWDPECQVVTVDMDENPHLDESTKQRVLSRIPPAMLAARKSGLFVHFAGEIYPDWDPDRHVIPEQEVPLHANNGKAVFPVFEGIDPGLDHPAAWVAAWVEPTGRLIVFDSFKLRGANVEEVCAEIMRRRELHGYGRPRWVVIDPSARNKHHATGRSLQDEYRRCGVHTIPGQNARLAGFSRVSQLLKADPPRLLVTANNSSTQDDELPGLIEEFPLYRWRSRTQGEGPSPQEPVKLMDDLLDALRYLIMSNPTGLATRDDDDLPPTDPGKFDEWDRARKLRDHVSHLAQRAKRRTGRSAVGTAR